MASKFRNFISKELIYLLGAPTLVMLGIVVYGILFDFWYKDAYNIFLASVLVYGFFILIRILGWLSRKVRK